MKKENLKKEKGVKSEVKERTLAPDEVIKKDTKEVRKKA